MNVGDRDSGAVFLPFGLEPVDANPSVIGNVPQEQERLKTEEANIAATFVTALNELFKHNEQLRNRISSGKAKFTYNLTHRGGIYTLLRLMLQRTNWFDLEKRTQDALAFLIEQDHHEINGLREALERAKTENKISQPIADQLLELEGQIRAIEANPLSVNEEQVRRISGAIAPLLVDLNPQAAGIGEAPQGDEHYYDEVDEIARRLSEDE